MLTARPSRPPASLSVMGISKSYGGHSAVCPTTFDVEPGTFVTMLGPSGSGKTTILKMIAGFEPIDSGAIMIAGEDVARVPAYKRDIGFVFQQYALFPHLSVRENISYPLRMRGVASSEASDRVSETASLMGLHAFLDRKPSMLSGGQQQRVALARAIVFRPRLLLMDEPMAALDKRLREEMQVEIRNLQRRLQITTIAVTHDQTEALVMSDTIIVLSGGRIEQIGAPDDVYHSPRSLFVARFLGESNVISGTARTDGHSWWIECVNLPPLRAQNPVSVTPIAKAHYVIRPECVTWGPETRLDTVVEGCVTDLLFAGDVLRMMVRTSYGEIIVKRLHRRSDATPEVGEKISLSWRSADAVLVPHSD